MLPKKWLSSTRQAGPLTLLCPGCIAGPFRFRTHRWHIWSRLLPTYFPSYRRWTLNAAIYKAKSGSAVDEWKEKWEREKKKCGVISLSAFPYIMRIILAFSFQCIYYFVIIVEKKSHKHFRPWLTYFFAWWRAEFGLKNSHLTINRWMTKSNRSW